MRRYRKAVLIAIACAVVLGAALVRAFLVAPKPLSTAEVLAATREAIRVAVGTAIARGGLLDSAAFVTSTIESNLDRQGFGGVVVHLIRANDLNPLAAFFFSVNASGVVVRFDLEGTIDPLLAIRLGLLVPIRADPFHPYTSHREPAVLAACLREHRYHLAPDAPDFFARLENRTRDPYHFGFETFVTDGSHLAVDHTYLETGAWGLNPDQRARYGL